MKNIQIGVIGSYSDIKYQTKLNKLAEKIGYLVAKSGAVLITGGEKGGGLPEAATRGAKKARGLVIGITRESSLALETNDAVIQTSGLIGLREYILIVSCDVVIAINGGSGTLNEITVAYQNNIPVIVMAKSGGWSEKLANTFLDTRKRYKFRSAKTPAGAVGLALALVKKSK